MTVAPTTDPSGRKCWSMPALRPRMSGRARSGAAFSPPPFAVVVWAAAMSAAASAFASSTFSSAMSLRPQRGLELDLDVDASRQVRPHERVDRLLRGIVDVDQPLVRADLEL